MPFWLWCAISSVVVIAASTLLSKHLANNKGVQIDQIIFYQSIVTAFFSLSFLLRSGISIRPNGKATFFLLIFNGLLYYAINTTYLTSANNAPNAGYTPAIVAFNMVLVLAGSRIFFGDELSATKVVGALIMLIGAFIIGFGK